MLRIELGAEDIGRIRFAEGPAPVLETVLILSELRNRPRRRTAAPGDWRTRVSAAFPQEARPLLELAPPRGIPRYLDVLTADSEQAFAAVLDTATTVHADNAARIERVTRRPSPTWLRRYADGDPRYLCDLNRAMRTFHASCLSPQWRGVTSRFHQDVDRRLAITRDLGVNAMLSTLCPGLRFNGNTLEGPYPWDRRVQLNGRGLILMPSSFWTGHPLVTWDPLEPDRHVLIYPAHPDTGRPADPGPYARAETTGALSTLLGATRAAMLTALRQPRTTSGLAQHLGIGVSTASEHATALRGASLVESHRDGKSVEHRLTHLGLALLDRAG